MENKRIPAYPNTTHSNCSLIELEQITKSSNESNNPLLAQWELLTALSQVAIIIYWPLDVKKTSRLAGKTDVILMKDFIFEKCHVCIKYLIMLSYQSGHFAFLVCYLGTEDRSKMFLHEFWFILSYFRKEKNIWAINFKVRFLKMS